VGALRRDPARTFAVLYLDLDRFKLVNDSAGHEVGDQLLCAVARRVRKALRPTDFFARIGGDEFAAIVYDVDRAEQAQAVTRRIHGVLESPFRLGELRLYTSTSIGIVLGDATRAPDQHLRQADTAMYSAKQGGAGANRVYRDGLRMEARGRLHLESDLHRAVEEEAFELHYQPIIDLRTAQLRGFEALIRWEHPERGWISPCEFIPIAEETGLIRPIGQWVLGAACRAAASWSTIHERAPTVSINVSPREFREPGLPDRVAAVLDETGLDPSRLLIEITEGCMIDEEATIALLDDLKDLGIRLAVDDFGTGYSSLSYLSRLPLDMLKIDHTFVAALGTGHHDETVVRAIVTLAHELEMSVVAEGIETPAQLGFLSRQGCELGQGYLIGRPQALTSLADLPKHLEGVSAL